MGMDEGPDEQDERSSERTPQRRKIQRVFPLVKYNPVNMRCDI